MTDNPARTAAKSPPDGRRRRPKDTHNAELLGWLPADSQGRPIDGRTVTGRWCRLQTAAYIAALSRGKPRSLTVREAAGVKSAIRLELMLNSVPGSELSPVIGELRRVLTELGLPDASAGDAGAPDGPDSPAWDLTLLSDTELADLERLAVKATGAAPRVEAPPKPPPVRYGRPSAPALDVSRLTAEERAIVEPVLARLAKEDAAKATEQPAEPESAAMVALRTENSILRERVANQERLAAHAAAQVPAIEGEALPG